MKHFVIVKVVDGEVTVIGNKNAEPFSSEVNAQRSLTRRKGRSRKTEWHICEVEK